LAKEQQVAAQLHRQNSSIHPSAESYRLAEYVALEEIDGEQNSPSLKQSYISLMDQLEIDGYPKQEISTVGKNIILTKKIEKLKPKGIPESEISVGRWWWYVAKERGCIDPHYSHPKDKPDKKPKNVFEQENDSWLAVIEKFEDYLKAEKTTLRNKNFNSKIPENESREALLIMNRVIDHANERLNNKTKIPPSHYSILMRDSFYASGTLLSQNYYLHVKEKEKFTKKQYQKVVRGIMKDMPARFEPNDEDQSDACGFSGVPCPKCGSYRTEFVSSFEKIVYEDVNGNKYEHGIKVRRIKCFAEDRKYQAPMPTLPAAEISKSEW